MVCVDGLVAVDDELRRIERLVDWEHVRATARPFYRPGGAGRLGIDPAVLVKLALVLAWRGLASMRATLKVAATDVSIRRFLGFGVTERLPDHSTFSQSQTQRFADSSVFERLFTAVLRQCSDAALVGGSRLVVDGTHIEADAALKSLRAELAPVACDAEGAEGAEVSGASRPGRGRPQGAGDHGGAGLSTRPAAKLTPWRILSAARGSPATRSPGWLPIGAMPARTPMPPSKRSRRRR